MWVSSRTHDHEGVLKIHLEAGTVPICDIYIYMYARTYINIYNTYNFDVCNVYMSIDVHT